MAFAQPSGVWAQDDEEKVASVNSGIGRSGSTGHLPMVATPKVPTNDQRRLRFQWGRRPYPRCIYPRQRKKRLWRDCRRGRGLEIGTRVGAAGFLSRTD